MSAANGPPVVSHGLVLYLDVGNPRSYPGIGVTWTDLIDSLDATLQEMDGSEYENSYGGCLNFDGTKKYVTLASSTELSGDFTYCIWVNRRERTEDEYTIMFSSTLQAEQFQLDRQNYPGAFGLFVDGAYNSTDNNVIPLDTWVYLSWQRKGTGLYGYLNGVEQFNPSNGNNLGFSTVSIATSRINKIGSFNISTHPSSHYDLIGKISNIQVYNRSLSELELTQNFNALRGRFGI